MEIYTPKPKIKLSPVVRNGREFVEVTFGNDNDIRLSLSKEENVLLVGGRAYLPAENFVLAEFFDRYVKMAFIDYSAIKETAPRKEEDKRPPLPEAYDPAPALSAPCSEPCPETCSAPAAETTELAEETLTTAVMPESPVMADSLTHGQRVAAIAATLFQDLAELHGLDDVWGHRLHLAAQLHDIGFAEGRKGHHKISMRLIEEDLSLNIHEDDRPWVALLARYHRKAWPSRRHARFDALKKSDRKALRKAASLLRIADALDYTHTGVVGNLAVAVKKRKVIIAVQCSGDCSAEMERVIKKGDLFMHVFGRELECVCQGN